MNDTEKLMREKFGDFNVDADMMRDVYMTDSQRDASGEAVTVWKAEKVTPDDGGFYRDVKYATTKADMLILKDKGYTITEIREEENSET